MHDFTPASAAVGGALIALSLGVMLVTTGRIAGLSGVFAGLLRVRRADRAWRAWFVGGMLAVGALFEAVRPETYDSGARVPLAVVALAGALVGAGTRLSNGCTSGHGLCGMSRASKRSIVATLTFFAAGVATATIVGRLL
jgi:hypothetical protein|nr:YeeE/YedE family protein [Kofleriaceae bacterium]